MSFSSLRGRLWASYALLIAGAIGLAALFVLIFLLRNPLATRETQARVRAAQAALLALEARSTRRDPDALQRAAEAFQVRLVLFSRDGAVLQDTEANGQSPLALPGRGILNRAPRLIRDEAGRAWQYAIHQLADGTLMLVAAPRPRMSILADDVIPFFLESACIASLLALAMAYLLARWIADPLQRLMAAANASPPEPVRGDIQAGPTEARALVQSFNAMVARLRASQKAQRELTADVSHELRTPVTSIRGFAQAILDGTANTPEARRQAAEVIHSEAGRMERLIRDLLDLERLEAGGGSMSMGPVDLLTVVRNTVRDLEPLASQGGVTLRATLPDVCSTIRGDPDRLTQAFTNLIENGLKFVERGGHVDVILMETADSDAVEVSVSDDGKGISQEDMPRVFDRFFQGDRSRQRRAAGGAGLGLAIAREIVQAHDGRISVRSTPGQGTTFTVCLPTR
jgi:signal transduction histidine kinase